MLHLVFMVAFIIEGYFAGLKIKVANYFLSEGIISLSTSNFQKL